MMTTHLSHRPPIPIPVEPVHDRPDRLLELVGVQWVEPAQADCRCWQRHWQHQRQQIWQIYALERRLFL